MPCSTKKPWARYLSEQRSDRLELGHEHERAAEIVAGLGEHDVVEVGQRDDQPHVVQLDEIAQRGDVAGVVDARHERAAVGVVERGRELVRRRWRSSSRRRAERGDDVDALARAREQDGRHDRGG